MAITHRDLFISNDLSRSFYQQKARGRVHLSNDLVRSKRYRQDWIKKKSKVLCFEKHFVCFDLKGSSGVFRGSGEEVRSDGLLIVGAVLNAPIEEQVPVLSMIDFIQVRGKNLSNDVCVSAGRAGSLSVHVL